MKSWKNLTIPLKLCNQKQTLMNLQQIISLKKTRKQQMTSSIRLALNKNKHKVSSFCHMSPNQMQCGRIMYLIKNGIHQTMTWWYTHVMKAYT